MAGMNRGEKAEMSRFILETKARFGTTMALIEHDMSVVMELSDHIVVLDYGRKDCRRYAPRRCAPIRP